MCARVLARHVFIYCHLTPPFHLLLFQDPNERQMVSFPQLGMVSQEQLAQLRSKLLPTDDLSFHAYFGSLFVTA